MSEPVSNLEIIRATYEGPSEQNGKNLIAALASDAVWVEAAGFPYAGTYTGPEDIIAKVRNIRSEMGVDVKRAVVVRVAAPEEETQKLLRDAQDYVFKLAQVRELQIVSALG